MENRTLPMIRFTAFGNEKGYSRHIFEDIFTFSSGKNIKQNEASPEYEVPCVRYGELYHMYGEVITKIINCTNLPRSELTFSFGNEILLPSAGEDPLDIGSASALTLKGVAIGRTINVLRPNGTIDYSPLYVSFYINEKLRKKISTLARGASISNVYNSDLKGLKINLPSLDEQRKVAEFLSSVDKKISLLKEKHILLTQYKKGVMQKLFKQEIRFKDVNGNDFPDWQEKTMSQVLKPEVREVAKPSEKYLALGIRSHMKGTFQKPDSDPEAIAMDKLYVVRANDLVVNITFAWEGAIAIAQTEDDGGLVSHRFPTYIFKPDQATHRYFKHIIQLKRFKYMLDIISPGGAGRNRVLSKAEFLKLKWNLPSVKEQEKIADFLDTLDTKLDLVNQQIELTQTFKKGLLQQMFV